MCDSPDSTLHPAAAIKARFLSLLRQSLGDVLALSWDSERTGIGDNFMLQAYGDDGRRLHITLCIHPELAPFIGKPEEWLHGGAMAGRVFAFRA